jgi:DNA-binding Lrp family transcriptional regulator
LDDADKRLLGLIQKEVPVISHPFAALGENLDSASEAEVIARIRRLKEQRVIRQISAIFDTKSLGYESSLVAVKCDPARVDEVAAVIGAHPGVSHNYKRDHAFNLWYTIAVAPSSKLGLERTTQILHDTSGAFSTRLMPTLHLFKIGVELDVEGKTGVAEKKAGGYSHRSRGNTLAPLGELDIQFIREMQKDLAIEPEPFAAIASRLGISLDALQKLTAEMITTGRLRRYSAVLRHREVGFSANGMGVWAVPGGDAEIMATGEKMAAYRAVTHCYRRPSYPDWPYNIFTMIHAHTTDECHSVIDEIARETGVKDHSVLFSTKEYKKTRVQYFTDEESAWEARYGR